MQATPTRPIRPAASLGRGTLAGLLVLLLSAPVAAQTGAEPDFTPPPPPSLNFYGSPGLIDMPGAHMMPDGQFTTTLSHFAGQSRLTLSFQAFPWMSASFRYNGIQNWNLGGFDTYYDRGFDVRFRLLKESRRWPEITLGLQDFVGTGVYAGEYLVTTKTFATRGFGQAGVDGRLRLTGGLGWGRLGSHGSIGSYGTRPKFTAGSTGGKPAYDQWFRGDVAPFAGIEWQPNEKLGLKLEYSSDAYVTETTVTSVFQRDSNFNFGLEYQATPRTRIGAYYLYGSEFGITAQIQLNPKQPPNRMAVPAPQPIQPRSQWAGSPATWDTGWAASQETKLTLRDRLAEDLNKSGLILESLTLSGTLAELRYRNPRYQAQANAAGRAARALAATMPPSVETFRVIPVSGGMALLAVTLRRSDLEALEYDAMSADALLAVTGFGDAPAQDADALVNAALYPDFSWSLEPYFKPGYFDPDQPFRLDAGISAQASWRPAPGWVVAGEVRQRLAGNLEDGRASNSVLPRVRTEQVRYSQADTTLRNLYGAYQWRAGHNLYARLSAGYFEEMYGGLSGEVLWKPVNSALALGVEGNYVRKRDYDQRLGFQDYSVATGHVSAYYDFGQGYLGQIDVGRYLAGDTGATFSMERHFDNGWMVGGFFTLTDVSSVEFGEGSFDKGVRLRIPLGWFLGKPSRQYVGTTVRPIQRDGGQRVTVPGRLYGQIREAHGDALRDNWARAWE